jgi:hypothetical protein
MAPRVEPVNEGESECDERERWRKGRPVYLRRERHAVDERREERRGKQQPTEQPQGRRDEWGAPSSQEPRGSEKHGRHRELGDRT